jgi:ATP-dependent RNA helicase DHX37/DHR1
MKDKSKRFNAKARAASRETNEEKSIDTNALIIDPTESVKETVVETPKEVKMNPKKRKRLEKYIEKKLKKEQRVILMQQLA